MDCKQGIYGRKTVLLSSATHLVDNGHQIWSEMRIAAFDFVVCENLHGAFTTMFKPCFSR